MPENKNFEEGGEKMEEGAVSGPDNVSPGGSDEPSDVSEEDQEGKNSKLLWVVVVVLALVAVAALLWTQLSADRGDDANMDELGQDSPAQIQAQLDGLNVDSVDDAFQQIEQDMQEL